MRFDALRPGFRAFLVCSAPPGPKNRIVSPGERVDAVDLHEPELGKNPIQVFAFAGSCFPTQQQVTIKKEAARALVFQGRSGHFRRLSREERDSSNALCARSVCVGIGASREGSDALR